MKGVRSLCALLAACLAPPALGAPAVVLPPAAKTVLFVRKGSPKFTEVFETMRKELTKRYTVVDYVVDKGVPYKDFKETVDKSPPALAVYMDNQAVNFGIRYNQEQSVPEKKLKGVALMALNLKTVLKGNAEIAGVAFESPAYTLVTQFRFLLKSPVASVLVLYRKSVFEETVTRAADQLKAEGIKLHAVDLEESGMERAPVEESLKRNLRKHAVAADKYDVVWVPLDSVILTPDLFRSHWIPVARESKLPFITGTDELVSKELDFGTFAITPSLPDLASQAAQMVEAILADHVPPKDLGVEELISVNKYLNLDRAAKVGLKLKPIEQLDIRKAE